MAGSDWSQHYKSCGLPLNYLVDIFPTVARIFSLSNAVEFERDVALFEGTGRNYRGNGLGPGSLPGSSGDKRMAGLVDALAGCIAAFRNVSVFNPSPHI